MMGWRDRVQPASFRGVSFQAETGSEPVGRQTQVHEYPQRDLPMVEDLGRRTRPIKLTAWIAGDDVFERRDALLKALDEPGQGELVHPWMGRMTVTATDCEMTHDRREGGVVRFDLVFVAGGELAFPSAQANTAVQTGLAADDVRTTGLSRFERAMAGVNLARLQLRNVQTLLQSVSRELGRTPVLRDVLALVQDTQAVYVALRNAPDSLARALLNAAGSAQRVFTGFSGVVSGDSVSLSGIDSQARAIRKVGQIMLPTDSESAAVGAAYVSLVQDAVLVSALSDIAQIPAGRVAAPVSGVAAVGVRADVVTTDATHAWMLADTLLAGPERRVPVADDVRAAGVSLSDAVWGMSAGAGVEHFESLAQARIRAGQHLVAVSRSGTRLVTIEPQEVVPALVLAYRQYEDASRAGELLARNRIEHPGFVPVRSLEVAQS